MYGIICCYNPRVELRCSFSDNIGSGRRFKVVFDSQSNCSLFKQYSKELNLKWSFLNEHWKPIFEKTNIKLFFDSLWSVDIQTTNYLTSSQIIKKLYKANDGTF